jgi:hypothetical protein
MSKSAKVLLDLCNKAYNSKDKIVCGNEAFYITTLGGDIFVSFAGSDDFEDWKENFHFSKRYVRKLGLTVHAGFWDSMVECWAHLESNIEALIRNKSKIILTGHSKGAAIAFCARLMFIECGYDPDIIHYVGFAQPRVLRKSSKRRYKRQGLEANTTIYEVQGDPVIRLPRSYMGFTHVYNRRHYAKMPWYRRIPGVRAMNHKIETYIAKFS